MADQNSVVMVQIRPDDLMAELGIKKDAYYAYLKHLDVKAEKDLDGKAFLTEEQANLVRALRSHVNETGKMEGFANANGFLIAVEDASLLGEMPQAGASDDGAERPNLDLDDLIRAAAELKGQQLVMPQLVIRELASRMTYDDLPDEVRVRVDQVRESTSPKFQPAQLANDLLSQWRTSRKQQAA